MEIRGKLQKMKLTKSVVQKIEPPDNKDQAFHRDDQLKGFALRVTASGVKSFIVEKLINGKVKRITLGRYGELTVEQARKEAQKLLGMIATGIDPLAKKQEAKAQNVKLKEVFQAYIKARKDLKPKTLYDYGKLIETAFCDWQGRPLLSITKDKVIKRHTKLGEERGFAYANLAMRMLRAIFNFAAGQYEDSQGQSIISENPVKRLSQTRAWYRIERRQTYIKPHEFPAWYEGVMQLKNETLRDYLIFMLFTGLRRQEAARLKWSDIDLKAKTLSIKDTKNKQAHSLPLTNFLYDLLFKRQSTPNSSYVFPGTGKGGYIVEPRKQTAKVIEHSGVNFTVHDLRRTFITVAESLDISAYAVKRLVNHKMTSDVTAGYIVSDVERLRKPMQQITDYFLLLAGLKQNKFNKD
jgi:integrase